MVRLPLIEKPGIADQFSRAIVSSGHMIDLPDREMPRFPPEKEALVRRKIDEQLEAWQAGPGDLAVCGAARGSDILFAESCHRQGVHLRLLIALDEPEYLQRSVRLAGGSSWEARYFALKWHAQVWFAPERLGPLREEEDPFVRLNLWMLETARAATATNTIHGLFIWDEKETGDGPGGTAHLAQEIQRMGGIVRIINPVLL